MYGKFFTHVTVKHRYLMPEATIRYGPTTMKHGDSKPFDEKHEPQE
jgi:hypothetical protein